MLHSGLIVKQGLFVKLPIFIEAARPNFIFHSGVNVKQGLLIDSET